MYVLWHDRDYDFGRWVYLNSDLSKIKEKTVLRPIPKTNAKSTILSIFEEETDYDILPVIKFETPDIIIQHIDENTKKSKIVFVTEFMTHTPQHHHPLQRFSRIYGSSKLKIPVALVLPNLKEKIERKEGVYKPTKYKTNPLIYHIFIRTTKINRTPTLIFLWPEKEGYLKYDKRHPTAPFIDDQINRWLYFLNKCIKDSNFNYEKDGELKKQIDMMMNLSNYKEFKQKELAKNWDSIYKLKTIRIIPTIDVINEFKLDKKRLNKNFMKNGLTLIFEPLGLHAPSTPFRTDPYAGMLCAFDNLFCRTEDDKREINLILRAENIEYKKTSFREIKHKKDKCPFINIGITQKLSIDQLNKHLDNCPFTFSKQQRIYGEVADVIVFDDQIYYNK
ncbi:MAG: hypothetical protein A7315_08805 [Candidatus Altiarchaeales archaeon WOR_SM1_79]|nr:MAG: hypothetical protein A7315_08805 [Candidatus Altiarchaeales archaeon WOR_SM1_79]